MNNELTTTEQTTGEAQADETIVSAESPALQASAVPPQPSLKQRPSEINNAFRRSLKARGHHLKPVVQIGQGGISPGVIEATQAALEQHELIKVSINGESPTERKKWCRGSRKSDRRTYSSSYRSSDSPLPRAGTSRKGRADHSPKYGQKEGYILKKETVKRLW